MARLPPRGRLAPGVADEPDPDSVWAAERAAIRAREAANKAAPGLCATGGGGLRATVRRFCTTCGGGLRATVNRGCASGDCAANAGERAANAGERAAEGSNAGERAAAAATPGDRAATPGDRVTGLGATGLGKMNEKYSK